MATICMAPMLAFAADSSLVIKEVPAKTTSPASGRQMYNEYCATCHGVDGKGHGPAAPALKVSPPDLSQLSKNNSGKFPDRHVYSAIRGDVNLTVHGSADMPIWGVVFREMNGHAGNVEAGARIANLCRYIETLQQK